MSFAAPDIQITRSEPTTQEYLLTVPVKTELGLASRQQDSQVGNLENKAASPRDWQSMADLSLIKDDALKKYYGTVVEP